MAYLDQKISLIIPTLNAEKYIEKLFAIIDKQTVKPDEIIIIDSASDDKTVKLCKRHDNVKIIEIKRADFDHGGTRNQAIEASIGDIVLMLSQDVTPIHEDYIEKLIFPLITDESIAACSGRQIAYPDATLREKLVRQFNYKDQSFVRDESDLKTLGIKTFFLSDSCAAFKRKCIFAVGLYNAPCLASEDMILSAKLIYNHYKIAYVAEADVFHSHDYPIAKQYKRDFDTGALMTIEKDIFCEVKCETEGIKMAIFVLSKLLSKLHLLASVYFCVLCAIRLKAHRDGKKWEKMPKEKLFKRTTNPEYFIKAGFILSNG